jgi:hypothetical protein
MEADRFDALTKRLAAGGASRRAVLKRLAGGALGGWLGRRGPGAGAAPPCFGAGHPCTRHQQCCSGACAAPGPGAAPRCVAPTTTTTTTAPPTTTTTTTPPPCVGANQNCATASDTCCDALYVCGNNFCGQSLGCCGTAGASCIVDCDCCGAFFCHGGTCG